MKISLLPEDQKLLVLVGVLLDSAFVSQCLAMDKDNPDEMVYGCEELLQLPPEYRIPYISSVLRYSSHTT